jgi:DNA repair protein RadC
MGTEDPSTTLHRALEMRVDSAVYRAGLAPTRRAARQAVSHGHIMINGRRTTVPSHPLKKGDVITIREGSRKSPLFAGLAEKNAEKLSLDLNIPIIKACQIIACGEIGRRFYEKNRSGFTVIRNAKDVFDYLVDMRNLPKEHLRGLYLNSHNRIIHDEIISIGTINTNIVHPREIFRPGIEYTCAAVVLAHNHPSGVCTPSTQDIEITEQIIQAGKVLGINVLDHVIITKDSFVSISANYN